jgi:hypothetical protein
VEPQVIVDWVRRVRRIFKDALAGHEALDDKAWELDAELSKLYYSLRQLYDSFKQALRENKIARARELLKEAERILERFKRLIDKASDFNVKARSEWDTIKFRAVNRILDYEHKIPTDLKGKLHDTYINVLFDLEPPISVFAKRRDHYLSNAEWLVSLMREEIETAEKIAKRLG